jgi:hypothetical protein
VYEATVYDEKTSANICLRDTTVQCDLFTAAQAAKGPDLSCRILFSLPCTTIALLTAIRLDAEQLDHPVYIYLLVFIAIVAKHCAKYMSW